MDTQMQSSMPSGDQEPKKRSMGLWSSLILIVVAGLAGYFIGRGNTAAPADNSAIADKEPGESMEKEVMEGETMEGPKTGPLVTIGENKGGSQIPAAAPNLVAAGDQLAGSRVTLERVVLKNEGWVAIHDSDNGVAGRILGAALVAAGEQETVTVDLVRATEAGKSYFAMLHASNGDREFQFRAGEADAPLTDASGNPVMASFKAL